MREESVKPLLLRIAGNDEQAMDELFNCTQTSLLRFFFRLSHSSFSSEDLLQNTFLRLWNYRGHYRGQSARGYIYQIALNEWRTNYRRRQKRTAAIDEYARTVSASENNPPEANLEKEEAKQRVRQAVNTLPDNQREAFILHRIEGLNCREIAEVLDAPRKTIESRLRLALQKLVARLKANEGDL